VQWSDFDLQLQGGLIVVVRLICATSASVADVKTVSRREPAMPRGVGLIPDSQTRQYTYISRFENLGSTGKRTPRGAGVHDPVESESCPLFG
jgi:hypothetical protein